MKFWKKKEEGFYEKETARLEDELGWHDPNSDEYGLILDRIERVSRLGDRRPRFEVSGETVARCATYLIGISAVIWVELKGGLIRSGAEKYIPRP